MGRAIMLYFRGLMFCQPFKAVVVTGSGIHFIEIWTAFDFYTISSHIPPSCIRAFTGPEVED